MLNNEKFNKQVEQLKDLNSPSLDHARKEQLKFRLLSKLGETNFAPERYTLQERGKNMLKLALGKYALAAFVPVLLLGGTAYASADARPGDALFQVRKATEKLQLAVTASSESKADLHTKIAEDRLEDVAEVSSEHKVRAEAEAQAEVSNAIEVLTEVQTKLEEKGNATAAAAIEANIARLRLKAEATQETKVKGESKVEDDTEENDDSTNRGRGLEHRSEMKNELEVEVDSDLDL
jgi:hypothetical protein